MRNDARFSPRMDAVVSGNLSMMLALPAKEEAGRGAAYDSPGHSFVGSRSEHEKDPAPSEGDPAPPVAESGVYIPDLVANHAGALSTPSRSIQTV